ncbi:hypothetical protein EBB07_27385 [Paenibacillaceae bacterium]|nr:hypothetical protein EBB07_27385 [Paenibacillaceae bacterium]
MERKLKERMLEESSYSKTLKDEIWEEIEMKLDNQPQFSESRLSRSHNKQNKNMSGKKKIKLAMGIGAAAIAIGVFFSLPVGTAFMKDIQSWFAPEKKVEVEVEGNKEETQQELHHNETSEYVIYYDVDRYKLVQEEGKDIITTKDPLPDQYPDVSLVIEQNENTKPDELIKEVSQLLAGSYAQVRDAEVVTEPVSGYRISAIDGQEWDSKVTAVYVIDNHKEGSFVLTLNYFLEAAEGHGARFEQMLKQFQIVE